MRFTSPTCCKFIIACCCVFFALTQPAKAVVFALSNETGQVGNEVVVSVTADEFIDLIAIQGTIQFDTALVEFVQMETFDIAGWTGLLDTVPNTPGVVTFSFDKLLPNTGTTLTDGSTIFTIRFALKAAGETALTFINSPTPMNVADVNAVETTPDVVEGSILIEPLATGNDACDGAALLVCGSVVTDSTLTATLDAEGVSCPLVPVENPGVWFTFVGTGTTMQVNLECVSPGWDGRLSVYSGNCVDGLTCVEGVDHFCGFSVGVAFDTDLDSTYYVLVHDMAAASPGIFQISLECTVADNDLCANATPIACEETVIGSTDDGTVDVVPTCGDDASAGGVWYSFTGTGNFITVSTCGLNTEYDTRLSVYSGDCGNLVCITESDDEFGCGFNSNQSVASFQSELGTDYFFLVHGFLQADGQFELSVSCESLEGLCSTTSFPISDLLDPVEDTLQVTGEDGVITDLNVSFNILHPYIGDVTITLTSPSGTTVILYNQDCGGQEDMLATFDDDGVPNFNGCDMTGNIEIEPSEALAAFNGEDPNGVWTVTVADTTESDDGSLESWCLQITTGECAFDETCDDEQACTEDACDNGVCVFTPFSNQCVAPDNGGSADFPPPCPYNGQVTITDGLPPGSSLTSRVQLGGFSNLSVNAGGVLGGDSITADAQLFFIELTGSGALSGYSNTITLPLSMFEVHTSPRAIGSPVQSFDVDLRRLFGTLPPDADFDVFQVTAGTDLGLPSSGKVTLEQQGGDWAVSSYLDITYRIDLEGAVGGPFEGDSGSTTGTFRFQLNEPACDDVNSCTNDFCFEGICVSDTITCNDGDACTDDLCTDGICSNDFIECDTTDLCLEGICDNGVCVYTLTDCDDADECTDDICLGQGNCDNVAIVCDDADACNGLETCDEFIGCVPGTPVVCSDDNLCNGIETCDPLTGNCIPGSPLTCPDDGDTCTIESCDALAGCITTQNPNCVDPCDALDCNDNDVCTADTCISGSCVNNDIKPQLLFDSANECAGDTFELINNSLGVDAEAIYYIDMGADSTLDFTIPAANFPDVQTFPASGDITLIIVVENPSGCRDTALIMFQAVICDDSDACTADTCNALSCTFTPIVCDDGSACTTDGCDPLAGCTFTPIDCDDADLCTLDSCNVLTGCFTTPVVCDDGNACTTDEVCTTGVGCVANGTLDCDDADACTADNCNPATGCENTPVVCDDSSACTLNLCDIASGCLFPAISCADDGDTCTVEFCDSLLGCTFSINPNCNNPCDTLDCDDADACTLDSCEFVGGCFYTAVNCDDADLCTDDACDIVTGCSNTAAVCDDLSVCTDDVCVSPTGCVFTAISCDDSDACTDDDCDATTGCFYTPVDCDDADLCTTDGCDIVTGCTNIPVVCDDGDACTTDEVCDPILGCVANGTLDCNDNDACTTDDCVPATGCVNTAIVCDDSSACTLNFCDIASGCFFTSIACADDGDTCTVEFCDSLLGCTFSLNPNCADPCDTLDCDDADACTLDSCEFIGGCFYTPVNCDDNNACTTDACDIINGCFTTPVSCDDSSVCTIDACDPSTGCSNTLIVCDDSSACTLNFCDSLTGCFYQAIACPDDGDTCTLEICDSLLGCTFIPNPNCNNPCDTLDCDDADACTLDSCEAATGCFYTTVDCDDNSACTTDACDIVTGCSNTPVLCDDTNACTTDACDIVTGCVFTDIDCNDNDACTLDSCNTVTGCFTTAVDCDDNDLCTTDACDVLTGCSNAPVVCNDSSACTTDLCDPLLGCQFTLTCDDLDACTDDVCDSITGCSNNPIICDDLSACTTDDCVPATGCVFTSINCSDNNACNGIESCDPLLGCLPGTPLNCDDGDTCTIDNCDALAGCFYSLNPNCDNPCDTLDCDDGNACTLDSCDAVTGCFTTPVVCDDLDACTVDACDDATGCFTSPLVCDDLDLCTTDGCDPLAGCTFTQIDCSDTTLCTIDSCINGVCINTPIDCDDFIPCTIDKCDTGVCENEPIDCADADSCTVDLCDAFGVCQHIPVDCDDSDACTTDSCVDGDCIYEPVVCLPDADLCTAELCDPVLGCTSAPIDCADGDLCTDDLCVDGVCQNDSITCTPSDACSTSVCVDGVCVETPVNCDDGNACTLDSCNALTGCFYTNVICDDSSACTIDVCDDALGCVFTDVDCNDNSVCTLDSCGELTGCFYTDINCDDGDACTVDACDATLACTYSFVICDDLDACTNDFCDPVTGCQTLPLDCDDFDACTLDSCSAGSGCFYTNVVCDDSSACTTDACDISTGCIFTDITCADTDACTLDGCDSVTGCTFTAVDCDDNSLCTTEVCDSATGCIYTPVVCDDSDACTADACDALLGCTFTTITCDDNNACTTDACDVLLGCTFTDITCDDNNACTTDDCDTTTGCTFVDITCDDNSACTTDDCDTTTGCTFVDITCDDNNACTTDGCDSTSGCTFVDITCDDSDLCTTDDCDTTSGCTFTDIVCLDSDDCTADVCVAGICEFNTVLSTDIDTIESCPGDVRTLTPALLYGTAADYTFAWSTGDTTASIDVTPDVPTGYSFTVTATAGAGFNAICSGSFFVDAVDCDDSDACSDDLCTNGICTYTPVDCDDNSVCTLDSCEAVGGCFYTDIDCSDGDLCTIDGCDAVNGCVYQFVICDDTDPCTDDFCDPAVGCSTLPHDCDDANLCTVDSCETGVGCFYTDVVCDDGDLCTIDTCEALIGCTFPPVICDDGDPCTTDKCELGVCVFEPIVCDDGSVCTTDTCVGGVCQFNLISCDDGDLCMVDLCDSTTGCYHVPVDCNDSDFCTDDACVPADGSCAYTAHDCSDNSVCTLDSCEAVSGCFYTDITCDDFDACTDNSCDSVSGCFFPTTDCADTDACTEDLCDVVTGCYTIAVSCDDFNACTLDSCNSLSGCFYTDVLCNDSSLCTTDGCDPASGCVFTTVDCDDNDACTVDNCDGATGCFYVALNCDDADACTADACDELSGCFYTPTSCDDFTACTTEFCDPATGCVFTNVDCDDLNLCTIDNCEPLTGCEYSPLDCGDGDACTVDQCDPGNPGGCFYTNLDCNDLNACTDDLCSPAVGCNYTLVTCDDSTLCTTDVCDSASGCIFTVVDCNDNDFCTLDSCGASIGCFYTAVNCDDANACTIDVCDTASGCNYSIVSCDDNNLCTTEFCDAIDGCVYTDVLCDDASLCTDDGCDPASGCFYTQVNCDDNSLCTIDGCDPLTGCTYADVDCSDNDVCTDDGCAADSGCFYQAVVCDDNDPCTDDSCLDPIGCIATPIVCDDSDLCTTDKCEFGVCVFLEIPCDDGNECTDNVCVAGVCDFVPITCDDLDTCTIDICDPAIGCVFTRITGCGDPCLFLDCDDGDDCTIDACDSDLGTCVYACAGNAAHELLWQKALGGNSGDGARSIEYTADGGYIVAGYAWSNNGNVTGNHGQTDFWVVKLDASGNLLWQKALGGNKSETANSVKQTADGGYIVVGSTTSDGNGDVSDNNGPSDFWVVKLDASGNLVWENSYGGNNSEVANSVYQTADGGYVVAGWASSNNSSGDVSGNHGSSDFWVIKLDASGALVWQKALGGSKGDIANSIQQTADGGYVVAGYSASNNGNVSGNHGQNDFWVVKLTAAGAITWQKSLGGSQDDVANSVQQTADGGYVVAGTSRSNNGDVSGNHGQEDYWVVKLDAAGSLVWQKSLGGFQEDKANSVDETSDGGYFVAGSSGSNTGNVTGNHGGKDFWAVRLDGAGSLVWQKSLGGFQDDYAFSAQQTPDGGYVLAGLTNSHNNGDVTGHKGGSDFWVVRLDGDRTCTPTTDVDVALCSGETITIGGQPVSTPGTYYDTIAQANGCDSIVVYTVTVPNCNDGDPCTDDACSAGVCSNTQTVCDDGDLCTTDACGTAGCTFTAINCNDGNGCTTDECVSGTCINTPIPGCNCTGLTATITEQPLPVWCQGQSVTLVADLNTNGVSYAWSTGATTQSATVPVPGTYTVTVTDANNCAATATFTTSLDALLSSYVVIADRKVEMTRNTVFSGGVGVSGNGNKAEIKTSSVITAANTFVKADVITVSGGSSVTTQMPDPVTISLPAFEHNPNCGSDNDDDDDGDVELRGASINANANVTLNGTDFGGITIGKNATVTFTGSDINIENIYAREGATIRFTSNCVKIRICKKFQLEDDNTFNAEGKSVVLFVGQDVTVGAGSAITADIYMDGGKMTVKNSPANDPTVLRGLFIVHWLTAGDNAQWHQVTDCPDECYPQTPTQPCAGNAREVTGFTLVSATSDNDLGALTDGSVIDLSLTGPISIRADVCLDQNVESVKFQLNGSDFRIENLPVYSIAGDNSGNYIAWNVAPGTYTIKAIPYGGNNATGTVGMANEITITVIGCLPGDRRVTALVLVDAETNTDIGPITNGMVIDLGVTGPINVRADVCDENSIESVRFHQNGNQYRIESTEPYAYNGDNNGNYNNWTPAPGSYTIKATPYSGNNANGVQGTALQVTFTVVGTAAKMDGAETLLPAAQGDEATQLSAFPNPFTDKLNIEFTLAEDSRVKLEVFNLEGKLIADLFEGNVKAGELQRYEYNADHLADGMVIYRLTTSKGTYFGKAVLAK